MGIETNKPAWILIRYGVYGVYGKFMRTHTRPPAHMGVLGRFA